MSKYYQTSARKIRMMGPCTHGYREFIKHFGELPLTFDRQTCNNVIDKLHFADVGWFLNHMRDEYKWTWRLHDLTHEQRKRVFYRAVNKSTLNDILMAFGL